MAIREGQISRWDFPAYIDALKNIVLPQYCRICRTRLLDSGPAYYCPPCWAASPRIERPFCIHCGQPHPGAVGFAVRGNFACAACREKPNPHIRRIWGAARYEGAVEDAVKHLKFHGRRNVTLHLADLLEHCIEAELDPQDYDLLIPVPLHRVRLRSRGFNQSLLLAQEVLHLFPNAQIDQRLHRIRPTRTQSRLKGKARRGNVQGAFAVVGPPFEGARILLIDDVITTAGTVTECARALQRAGAGPVDVLAAALATPIVLQE